MHKVLVNRLGGQSLPRKSVVRVTDRPDMTGWSGGAMVLGKRLGRPTNLDYSRAKAYCACSGCG